MKDNKTIFYEELSQDFEMPEYAEFSKAMDDPKRRKALYDKLLPDYDLPDFETFSNYLAAKPVLTDGEAPVLANYDVSSLPEEAWVPKAGEPSKEESSWSYIAPNQGSEFTVAPFKADERSKQVAHKPFAEEHPMGMTLSNETQVPFKPQEKFTTTYEDALPKVDMEGTIASAKQTASEVGQIGQAIAERGKESFAREGNATDLNPYKTEEQKAQENYVNQGMAQASRELRPEIQIDMELEKINAELEELEREYYSSDAYLQSRIVKSAIPGAAKAAWDEFAYASPRIIELQKRKTALLQAKEYRAIADEISANNKKYNAVGAFFANAGVGAGAYLTGKLNSANSAHRTDGILTDKLSLSNKIQNGEALSQSEQETMTIYALEDMMESKYGSAERNLGYIAGYGAPQMIEFMVELALSPGRGLVKAGMSAGEKLAAKTVSRLTKKYGASAVAKMLEKMGTYTLKQSGRILGATGNAMVATATTQADDLVRGTGERMAGRFVGERDAEGNLIGTSVVDTKSLGRAAYEQGATQTIENLSEAIFEGMGIGKGVSAMISKAGGKVAGTKLGGKILKGATYKTVSELMERTAAKDWYQATSKVMKAMHLGSFPEEVMEEYAAIPMKHWAGVSESGMALGEELLSSETFYTTMAGLSLGMGGMTAVSVAPATISAGIDIYNSRKAHKALRKSDAVGASVFGAEWADIKSRVESIREEDFGIEMATLLEEYETEEQKSAIYDYMIRLQYDRGYNQMRRKAKEEQEGQEDAGQRMEEAYEEGYDMEDPQARNEAKSRLDEVTGLYGETIEESIAKFGGAVEFLRNLEGKVSLETMDIVTEYINLKETVKGIQDSQEDNIEARIEAMHKDVANRTHKQSGAIVTTQLLDEQGDVMLDPNTGAPVSFYVIDADMLVHYINGTAYPREGSAILRDANGKLVMVDNKRLAQLTPVDAETVKAQNEATIRAEMEAEANAEAPTEEAIQVPTETSSVPTLEVLTRELEQTEFGKTALTHIDMMMEQGEDAETINQTIDNEYGSLAPKLKAYYQAKANAIAETAMAEQSIAQQEQEQIAAQEAEKESHIIRNKDNDLDVDAMIAHGVTPEQMAEDLTAEFSSVDPGLALSTAQEYLAQVQEERAKTKSIIAKNGSLRKKEQFWSNVVGILTPQQESAPVAETEPVIDAPQAEVPAEAQNANAKWQAAPKVYGRETTLRVKGMRLRGRYVVAPAGVATGSHTADFADNADFIHDEQGRSRNPRDYSQASNQATTQEIAGNFALQNMQIVSPDGIVYDGNGRQIAGDIAAQNGTDGAYLEDLMDRADEFGFTPEQIQGMEHPRVYFEVAPGQLDYSAQTFDKFNAPEMKAPSAVELGAAMGQVLSDETFNRLADTIKQSGGLSAVYKSKPLQEAIAYILRDASDVKDVTTATLPQYYNAETRTLTEAGRNLLEACLLGKIFADNPQVLALLPKLPNKVMGKVAQAMPELAANMQMGEYALKDELANALTLVYEANQAGASVNDYAAQQDWTKGGSATDIFGKTVVMLAKALNGEIEGAELADVVRAYNVKAVDVVTGQGSMFETPTREQMLQEVINYYMKGEVATQEEEVATQEEEVATQEEEVATQEEEVATEESAPVTEESAPQQEEAVAQPKTRAEKVNAMSEEEFSALLASNDLEAMRAYEQELHNMLGIDEAEEASKKKLREKYAAINAEFGDFDNAPESVRNEFNKAAEEHEQKYSPTKVNDRWGKLRERIFEAEAEEAKAKAEAEKQAKEEYKKTAYNGFLAEKTPMGAAKADKALSKQYRVDGKVNTVAGFIEVWSKEGPMELRARQNGNKSLYLVNGYDFGKTAYDYAQYLQSKTQQEATSEEASSSSDSNINEKVETAREMLKEFGKARAEWEKAVTKGGNMEEASKVYTQKLHDFRNFLMALSEEELETVSSIDSTAEEEVKKEERRRHHQAALAEDYEKALSSQGEVTPVTPKVKGSIFDATVKDETRPVFGGVYHKDGTAVATDGRILIEEKGAYEQEKEGQLVDKRGNVIEGQRFPNWKGVIPKDVEAFGVSMESLRSFVEGVRQDAKKNGKKEADVTVVVKLPNGNFAYFESPHLVKFTNAAYRLGATELMLSAREEAPLLVQTEKGTAMLMPRLRASEEMYAYEISGKETEKTAPAEQKAESVSHEELVEQNKQKLSSYANRDLNASYYGGQKELNIPKKRAESLKDIDKSVSLRIENEFEDAIAEIREIVPIRDRAGFDFALEGDIRETSKWNTRDLEKKYEEDLGRLLSAYRVGRGEIGKTAKRSDRENVARILRRGVQPSMGGEQEDREKEGVPSEIWRKALSVALASRELDYREIRRNAFRDRYGLNPRDTISLYQLEEIFNATNTDKEVAELFEKVIAIAKSLGLIIKVEENDNAKKGALGKTNLNREVYLFLEPMTRTNASADRLPVVICHELLHQATIYSINLYLNGQTEGFLTERQIKAIETILSVYEEAKRQSPRFEDNSYGLETPYEFVAQMADPGQRALLDLTIWDRFLKVVNTFKNSDKHSLWERFKEAIKELLSLSDKVKMDQAIDTLLQDFNSVLYDAVAANGAGIEMDMRGEERASNHTPTDNQQIFDAAKEKFGTTIDMREAGYILPDGSMLDFSGKHEVRGADTSFLNGQRSVDHRAISDIAYDFDEEPTGVTTDLGDFLDRGAIRIDYNTGAINLNAAPTKEQKDRLRRLIEHNGGDVYIDFGKGWDTEHYVEYEGARAARVLADIDRYYSEGIKPEGTVMFRLREDAPPTKTGIGYKVFVLKDGKLYPPMVANPEGAETPVGVWLDADAAPVVGQSKTGRNQVKAGGKGTQGGSGTLAYRPGWHLGEIPYALQFNRKDENGERTLFPANFVWAEVEYANDVDYQEEAMSHGINANGKFQHSLAGLPRLPKNGAYKYRTNPNPETDPWIITGAMKVNRLLTPTEVDEMVGEAGREPQRRQEGAITDEQIMALNEQFVDEFRQGDGRYTDEELALINDPAARLYGESFRTKKQQKQYAERVRNPMRKKANELAEKLHLPVEIIESEEDMAKLKGQKAKAKGWYEVKSGKIVLVLPNNESVADIVETVLHEGVAHLGLRKLFGKQFTQFLDNVYNHAEQSIREKIDEIARKGKVSTRTATEEYLASLAETTDFENINAKWWSQIKKFFLDMLHTIGFDYKGGTISDSELRYILWRSHENLKEPNPRFNVFSQAKDIVKQNKLKAEEKQAKERRRILSLGKTDSNPLVADRVNEEETLYRMGDANDPNETAQRVYNEEMLSARFLARETMVDYLAALDSLQRIIAEKGGKIMSFQDAYSRMLALSSRNKQEIDLFDYSVMPELTKAIGEILGRTGKINWESPEAKTLQRYTKVKHGIERDRDMAVRKALPAIADMKFKEQFADINQRIEESTLRSEYEALIKERADMRANPAKYGLLSAEQIEGSLEAEWYKRTGEIRVEEGTWKEKQQKMDHAIAEVFGLDQAGINAFGLDLTEDYSGITETLVNEGLLTRKEVRKDRYAARKKAYEFVEQYEEQIGQYKTGGLWNAIKAVSGFALEKQRQCGLVSAKYVADCNKRFEFYVPLRGFNEEVAHDVYDYLDDVYNNNNPVQTAEGRESEAGNPFANLMNIGYRSITAGNHNLAVQAFWNLANRKDVKGFLVPSRVWHLAELTPEQQDFVREELRGIADLSNDEILPYLPEDASAEEIQDLLDDFEETMKSLKAMGYAYQGTRKAKQELRTLSKAEENAHRVKAYINGEVRYVTVVGNPRAAQALNGQLNPEQADWAALKGLQNFLAGAFTSQNPSFALANLVRDTQHANMRAFITENPKYWGTLTKKQAKLWRLGTIMKMLAAYENSIGNTGRHEWGRTLDPTDETHMRFKRFMEQGGATGFTFSRKQHENLEKLAKMAENVEGKSTPGQGFVVGEFFDAIRTFTEASELVNRFAAYETSLEMGRTEQQAIRDAKEITLNFNRKGAGRATYNASRASGNKAYTNAKYSAVNGLANLSQFGRDNLIFWNASVQGAYQLWSMLKKHPVKTFIAYGAVPYTLAAFGLPLFNALLCGGDDDKYYDELPEYERQRNICIKIPGTKGWFKIPLDPATQKIWAMGEATGAVMRGKKEFNLWNDIGANFVGLFSPVDIYWGDKNQNIVQRALSVGSSFTPALAQPLLHTFANRDWKGKPLENDSRYLDHLPSYKKAFKSDKTSLTELSKWMNTWANGDADTYKVGPFDFASPGVMEELLFGYTGGYGQAALAAVETAWSLVSDEVRGKFQWDKQPIINRFWVEGNPGQTKRTVFMNYNKEVGDFMEEVEQRRSAINRDIKNAAIRQDDTDYGKAVDAREKFFNSTDWKKYAKLKSTDAQVRQEAKGGIENASDITISDMLEAIEMIHDDKAFEANEQ